jgi:hypothetical protein
MAVVAPPAEAPASAALEVTELVGVPALSDADALPFVAAGSEPPAPLGLEPHEDAGETVFVAALAVDEPLPFAPIAEASERRFTAAPLTLRQLAAIHVELELAPARIATVLAHYHLTAEIKARLDAELAAWTAGDASVRVQWTEACHRYRAWRHSRRSHP